MDRRRICLFLLVIAVPLSSWALPTDFLINRIVHATCLNINLNLAFQKTADEQASVETQQHFSELTVQVGYSYNFSIE